MPQQTEATVAHWGGVFAMTLCVFSLVASEFMPVSLLTPIAGALSVSEGMAGQGIAISGASAVVTSLFISALAGSLNRKTLLLLLTAMMGLSGAIIAIAPDYITYMIGRALIGAVIGGSKQTFAVIALLARRDVRIGMLAVGCFFMGQFTLFTYLRPFLETVTGMSVRGLSLVLLMIGVAGFLGTTVIKSTLTRGFYRTLGGIPLVMAALAAGLIAFSGTVGMVVALLAIWGFLATAAPVGWWAWVPKTFPKDAEAGGGLMVAVVQLSIGLGSTIGGVLVDLDGYSSAFLASSALLVLAVLLTVATARRAAA